jgi:hypothetical protein
MSLGSVRAQKHGATVKVQKPLLSGREADTMISAAIAREIRTGLSRTESHLKDSSC